MNYWELRETARRLVPRMSQWPHRAHEVGLVKERGRKTNYRQFNFATRQLEKQERLLNVNEIDSFVEVSCRAAECPMPLNLDVWDGLTCTYGCIYCFANYFRASLYSSFFDNYKEMGLRAINPDLAISRLEEIFDAALDKNPAEVAAGVPRAIATGVPIRFGIRFEDFLPVEQRRGISLRLLQWLAEVHYPVMINTKSPLVGHEPYLRALADNPGRSAVHFTVLTTDEDLHRRLHPTVPKVYKLLRAAKDLVDAGVRVVIRIEPFVPFLNDDRRSTEEFIGRLQDIGVKHMTFDSYSYSANSVGIRHAFRAAGFDFDRIFLLGADSQWLSSLLLGKFMDEFRAAGISCSTFDFGNVPSNDDDIWCSVGDWFMPYDAEREAVGAEPHWPFSGGNILTAARFIRTHSDVGPVRWDHFKNTFGPFLTDAIEREVHRAWNLDLTHSPYTLEWVPGVSIVGQDTQGNLMWRFERNKPDFREEMLQGLL
jgi:DNA repair photolyase